MDAGILGRRMPSPPQIDTFRHDGFDIDEATGTVSMRYALDDEWTFTEQVTVEVPHGWSDAATEAARLLYLLSGVSYYKAAAPRTIDLGTTPVRPGEREFLQQFYVEGLGEFAYVNGLGILDIEVVGGAPAGPPATMATMDPQRALIPFGGGIDSIVTVEAVRPLRPASRLFVVGRRDDRYAAIEKAAAVTGLDVVRAQRHLDPTILRSRELGFRNGHVPVTGILSAIAALSAVLQGAGEVVMSNEWSASMGNVMVDGVDVNHQWSKSWAFEEGFRTVLDGAMDTPPAYYSFIRSRTELWVAQRFAGLEAFHDTFHSCNRAFHIDPAQRLDRWCGRCDKCAFIDLILSPFMDRDALGRIFDGHEPLEDPTLLGTFRALVGVGEDRKPFECVGDVDECRAAAALAADRPDRAGNPVLPVLLAEVGAAPGTADRDRMLAHVGPTNAPADLLG